MQTCEMLKAVRTRVHDLSVKHTAVTTVLAEVERHGWERLVASMSDDNRAKLVKMLAESSQATHLVLETVVSVYEHVIEDLVAVAEHELDDMAIRMDDESGRAFVCAQEQKGTNWLGLLVAGGVGYVPGKKS